MYEADFEIQIAYHICIAMQISVVVLLQVVKTQFNGSFHHYTKCIRSKSIHDKVINKCTIEVKDITKLQVRMFSIKVLLLNKESSRGGGARKGSNLT